VKIRNDPHKVASPRWRAFDERDNTQFDGGSR
jgi:hypothetical protein